MDDAARGSQLMMESLLNFPANWIVSFICVALLLILGWYAAGFPMLFSGLVIAFGGYAWINYSVTQYGWTILGPQPFQYVLLGTVLFLLGLVTAALGRRRDHKSTAEEASAD